MSKFLTGKELEEAIYDIIWDAKQKLLIVSPYIKLDDYFKKLFDKHENNPNIHLMLVFGKNETEVRKSMNKEDFEYFQKFPNVTIIHVPHLHAKYYGNEYSGMITSINLYDYSFLNNIEFGVYNSSSEKSFFSISSSTADDAAWDRCIDIAKESNVVFIKRPVYDVKRGILKTSKNYITSKVLHDSTEYY
ncbi:hypothetical protein GCM10007424_25640 [Flavobacterium suaedae]|uniref:Phospholipase D-like domain-containing protein n=1 Tax=Flavobacterium suaedae TaxID=1767027 RepID=A0ABQ1K149_9FLAO|nr:hypothetical protein [Flavobacterium suaedae]GGB84473.1 hypothetical protein GCM10007424_25640 [Flavobacterium suaedae]